MSSGYGLYYQDSLSHNAPVENDYWLGSTMVNSCLFIASYYRRVYYSLILHLLSTIFISVVIATNGLYLPQAWHMGRKNEIMNSKRMNMVVSLVKS